MPARIQLRRVKGWRKPKDVVKVARPTIWGNPFKLGTILVEGEEGNWTYTLLDSNAALVRAFRGMLESPNRNYPSDDEIRTMLRGRHLACYCRPDEPCHADVLLEIANV